MNNDITLKYIGYARKSSEDNKERQAASLPDQVYILEEQKTKLKLKLTEILQESQSAHKPGRDKFNSMLDRIESGEVNAIVTWYINRLARNPVDGGRIIYLFDTGKLIEILTPSRIYRNNPDDKCWLGFELCISKKDSDDKSVVVERGLNKKCRDGWRPGEGPFGYLNDRFTESGERKIYTDKERLPFVTKMFKLFLEDTSVKEIQCKAQYEWHLKTRQRKRIGGKPLTISMIYAILNNPFYFGRYEYPIGSGRWYEGKHEKAISEEIFNKTQIKLGNQSKYKLRHHEYAYTSLMKCGYCGSGIVAEEKNQAICSSCKYKFSLTKKNRDRCTKCGLRIEDMKNPTILHYEYYRCGRKKKADPLCKQRGLEVHMLEKLVDNKLNEIEISPLFMDWSIKQINKMNEGEINFREETIRGIQRAHNDCRIELDNLLKLKISPTNADGSLLSDERYKEENAKLEKKLKDIEKQLGNIDERMIQGNKDIAEKYDFAARAREKFASGDHKTKRDIFEGLGSHLRLLDKEVHCDSPKYMFVIKKMKKAEPSIAEKVAPELQSVRAKEMEALWASNPVLLRSRESHPA
jgi:DNA invertase Pin-like site-specific DNA recombinase